VTLQVLPFEAGAHAAMGGPFTILRFAEPDLADVVYIEQLTSALYLDKPVEVDSYLEVMEQLCLQPSRDEHRGHPQPDPRRDLSRGGRAFLARHGEPYSVSRSRNGRAAAPRAEHAGA